MFTTLYVMLHYAILFYTSDARYASYASYASYAMLCYATAMLRNATQRNATLRYAALCYIPPCSARYTMLAMLLYVYATLTLLAMRWQLCYAMLR